MQLNAYHDVDVDNNRESRSVFSQIPVLRHYLDLVHFTHLASVSSALCSMYLTTGLIDIFGMLSIAMVRVSEPGFSELVQERLKFWQFVSNALFSSGSTPAWLFSLRL